jgi:hypothetical protein
MPITEDSEFWPRLARRITRELSASRHNNMKFLWVDDFVRGTLEVQLGQHTLLAKAYVDEGGGKSFHYRVTLHLSAACAEAYHRGDWSRLMPPADSTNWLSLNRAEKEIDITCA